MQEAGYKVRRISLLQGSVNKGGDAAQGLSDRSGRSGLEIATDGIDDPRNLSRACHCLGLVFP
jgi:hypothetical protein